MFMLNDAPKTSTAPMTADRLRLADQRHSAREGLAISVTLVASAGLCFVTPAYFDAADRQRTIWFFCGGCLALFGCPLGVVSADRLSGGRVISDLGFAAIILIVATATGILAETGEFGPWVEGELKTMALLGSVVGFWALTRALLLWRAKRREPESSSNHPAGISQTAALVVATLGLLAGIINLFREMLSLRRI
jgi:hypothetical protein